VFKYFPPPPRILVDEIEGWLCPALFKYFESAPRELYGRAEPRP
jgi:hypothetical protein